MSVSVAVILATVYSFGLREQQAAPLQIKYCYNTCADVRTCGLPVEIYLFAKNKTAAIVKNRIIPIPKRILTTMSAVLLFLKTKPSKA